MSLAAGAGAATLVAGIDSSTQSCKVVVCDAETGAVVREARAPHPDTTEVDPAYWWDAWTAASSGLLEGVEALAVAGQQHGMVTLDAAGEVVRPALLWNDVRSAGAANDLVSELGGPDAWAEAVGSVPVASFTVTKLRWLAEHEPEAAARVERVMLPHDWLTWRLLAAGRGSGGTGSGGGSRGAGGEQGGGRLGAQPVTDRGDASGTGYWSPASGEYRLDLLRLAFGRELGLPRVAAAAEAVGTTGDGIVVAPGTGDNMGAALGLGLGRGDVVVSLGTSGTVFAVHDDAVADPSGAVAGFADATGRFLPLVCTLNAARVLSAAAGMLGADLASLNRLALSAQPGAGGLVLLPYLDGERTPNLPDAAGSLHGLRRGNMTPENLARAAVEGMLCGLADGLDALRALGVVVRRVLLVGGAARSTAVQAVAPNVFGAQVTVPAPGEYVALGAARQAAWVLAGTPEPPAWPVGSAAVIDTTGDDSGVRERYTEARRTVHGG
jgi:xylulokinase